MAARDEDVSQGPGANGNSFTCALCHEAYKNPKILPCFHTFCQECLSPLIDRGRAGSFTCPSCRREIETPSDGAIGFQSNFYIQSGNETTTGHGPVTWCPKHPDTKADIYCLKDDVMVCVTCFAREHNQHQCDNIAGAEKRCKKQLGWDRPRLKASSEDVTRQLEDARKELQDLKNKRATVEADIHSRHARAVDTANKCRDEALESLNQMTSEMESTHYTEVDRIAANLQELTKLQQRVQQALDSGVGFELVTVAREMRCGRGSKEAVQKLTTKHMIKTHRPVLRLDATPELTFKHLRAYIGTVARMEMTMSPPLVTVVEQFRCGEDPDTEVYCISPQDDGKVILSYTKHQLQTDFPSQEFSSDGSHLTTFENLKGNISWQTTSGGKHVHLTRETGKMLCTYAKSHKLIRLNSYAIGEGDVRREEVVSEDPLKTEQRSVTLINCGVHRAFDVDSEVKTIVVLEEAMEPELHRRVRLYRLPHPDAIATYSPPVAPFQPSDVCFYKLGGHEVLLVADELNDAIHVVNVQDGRLSFARYLSPGCPLLVQPTALNTDMRGRLWVACRGGKILTCTPYSEETSLKRVLEVYNPSLNSSDNDYTESDG